MLEMLRDLVNHKGHADSILLRAISRDTAAASDPELLDLLHHVLLANRFWLLTVTAEPFVLADESRPSSTLEALIRSYAETQAQESAWFRTATPADLERTISNPLIPQGECSVAHAYIQVCLHSQGHRAQAAKLLRRHGSTPPATDFILWVAERPEPVWPMATVPRAASD